MADSATTERSAVAEWEATRREEVRVVEAFTRRMVRELAANTGKGDRLGWLLLDPRELLGEIQHHYVKLHTCVAELDRIEKGQGELPRPTPWRGETSIRALEDAVGEFAADVANMAMMLADRCGVLGVPGAGGVNNDGLPAPGTGRGAFALTRRQEDE